MPVELRVGQPTSEVPRCCGPRSRHRNFTPGRLARYVTRALRDSDTATGVRVTVVTRDGSLVAAAASRRGAADPDGPVGLGEGEPLPVEGAAARVEGDAVPGAPDGVVRVALGPGADGLGVCAASTGVTAPLASRPTETTPHSTGRITGNSPPSSRGRSPVAPELAI